MGETKIFNKTNAELIEACQQQEPEELDDDGDTTTLKEEAPDPGILLQKLVDSSQKIKNIQKLLLV